VQGVRLGLLLALASLGLSLIFGTTGLSNFAHGELVTIGGVLAWFLTSLTGNLWLGGGLAVVVMAALGWVQDAGLWRPLRRRRLSLTQMMIVSIGLSIALQYVVQLWIGAGTVRIDKSNPTTVTIFGVTLTIQSYVAMGIAIVAIAAVGSA
jgi:branched-chain amino acid transport system permease protein